ncbi:MAG: flagellar hook-basal body complex protein [Deltaproteobacteria bacterium]|jgi:flagellar hook-basal body protein|nr:flagellar hook-basal body complex protein [Deltaproteobacteria bacterium]
MSISAAMYAAVTGLSALSTGMQVISNNIANVNTVGFKAARTNFEDLISQDYMSNGRIQQIGRGVKVASIQQMFTQGAFINSAQDTDMAIAGEGFFQVRDRVTNELMYTRAGNFTMDKDGNLETPAGYILQGWELSVPKPGKDPVRLGAPTDVKVIALNAPPLETSQIKVVVNLNADDSSAYIYSSAEFGVMYADDLAKGPAESARVSAANAVYNSAINGTAFPNSSYTFNSAYLAYLSANHIVPDPLVPGSYLKAVFPTAFEQRSAQTSASAAAWAWLSITDPDYPIAANSTVYAEKYNSAYVKYLSALGFTEGPVGTFKAAKAASAAPADLMAAASYALASAKATSASYGGYGGGTSTVDAIYASAYTRYMSAIGYVRPPLDYRTMEPSVNALALANSAGIAAGKAVAGPSYTGYDGQYPLGDLAYARAYATYLGSIGNELSSAYTLPAAPGFDVTGMYANAVSSATAAVNPPPPTVPTFTAYDPTSASISASTNLAYLQSLLSHMSGAILDTAWATNIPNAPVLNDGVGPDYAPGGTYYAAASAAGKAAAGGASYASYPSGDVAKDLAYLHAFAEHLEGLTPPVSLLPAALPAAEPALGVFTVDQAQVTAASAAALIVARTVGGGSYVYPSGAPSIDREADLAYVDAFAKSMTSRGYTVDAAYTAPDDVRLATYSNKAVGAADRANANLAGVSSAVAAGAPSTYGYPSDNTLWDAAYLSGYGGYFGATATSQLSITGFTTFSPTPAMLAVANTSATTAARTAVGPFTGYPSSSSDPGFQLAYNQAYEAKMSALGYSPITPLPDTGSAFQKMIPATQEDLDAAAAAAKKTAELAAKNAGQAAYDTVYKYLFNSAMAAVSFLYPEWQLEGMGFAGAWDGTDLDSPIDPENYTHANPWTIYDSLGTAHTLMVYYQPNPYMENVWDYLITCDPTEDARKDMNNSLVMNGSRFAGVIQKGKITFTADGEDRHGGLIKDIEAQNIDMSMTARATLTSGSASVALPATSSSLNHFTFGGYYIGSPSFSASTGTLVESQRQYTLTWSGNLNTVPVVSGFTWEDSIGNKGTIPVSDKNYTGPYPFGSGLSVSFHKGGTPMRFTSGDTLQVTANSEQIGWRNLTPNDEGFFDFDVAFVQSASMALHPPYPDGLPTIIQHIALDMGARYSNPGDPNDPYQEKWILDEQTTTQYASKSTNIFSSQDGYPPGSLQRISIDSDGILTGIYTNGRHQALYQIGLTRFINPWGLAKLGDNVYMETRWSGTGVLNEPATNGNGTIRANFLEQSNTDIADEIVNMIVTQRGFQANSKVVTTTDTMLAEVIEMKR